VEHAAECPRSWPNSHTSTEATERADTSSTTDAPSTTIVHSYAA
jgi:hypothetical protein